MWLGKYDTVDTQDVQHSDQHGAIKGQASGVEESESHGRRSVEARDRIW